MRVASLRPVSRVLVALAATTAALRWLLGGLGRVEVEGPSMVPALHPGDRLLVVGRVRLVPGRLVVVADPREPARPLVKRVGAGPGGMVRVGGRVLEAGPGEVVVLGDNPGASTDSRAFGPVPVSSVQGRPLYRYAPPERTGWL